MRRLPALLVTLAVAATASGQINLVNNSGFETDADGDRVPDGWAISGDRHVAQELTLGEPHTGKASAKLTCTRFTSVSPASHAMLCQMDVAVRRGAYYRVSFWARGEEIESDVVSLALSDTSVWANCGLDVAFAPTADWRPYEFIFRAERDCPVKSRLQLWFGSTGTLWVDDFEFVEGGRDLFHPGDVIPAAGVVNLVPNASFECGTAGWGSEQLDRLKHWGGSMNRLFGRLDSDNAFHGQTSLRIELGPNCRAVSFFDYYDLHRQPILGLLPFPSSHWSSGAPEDYDLSAGYVSRREHVAYAPRDEGDFENYVARTVGHYKDRVTWWQVFNKPVFTSYSLPRKFGYNAADYARWTKVFARAARGADPDCRILAGMGYLREGEIMGDWKQFLEAGGTAIRLSDEKLELQDMMGRPQPGREFIPCGTPVYVTAGGLTDEMFAAGLTIQR